MGFGMAAKSQILSSLENAELVLLTPDSTISVPLYWQQWGISTALSRSLARQIESCAQLAHQ